MRLYHHFYLSMNFRMLCDSSAQPVELLLKPFANQLPVDSKCKFRFVFRVFHHLEANPFGRELPSVFLRIKLALVKQRFATDERGGLPFVKTDFQAELLHVHQLLEQRKPFLGFLDDGFKDIRSSLNPRKSVLLQV